MDSGDHWCSANICLGGLNIDHGCILSWRAMIGAIWQNRGLIWSKWCSALPPSVLPVYIAPPRSGAFRCMLLQYLLASSFLQWFKTRPISHRPPFSIRSSMAGDGRRSKESCSPSSMSFSHKFLCRIASRWLGQWIALNSMNLESRAKSSL